jgi:small subunit ribosomal protein S20
MPIIKSAQKRVRSAGRKRKQNLARKTAMKQAVKHARTNVDAKTLTTAFKALDKAAKGGVIHRNRAARLKSRLSKAAKPSTS